MADYYPRVLVLSDSAFGDHSATAVTLTNLFRGWPSDCIALTHLDPRSTNPGGGLCDRIWQLSLEDVPIDRTIRRMLGWRKEQVLGRATAGMPGGLAGSCGQPVAWRDRLHSIASAWADLLPLRPPSEFEKWVTGFHPDVIYSMLANIRMLGLTRRLAVQFSVPVVPHFMDDWPTTYYRGWSKAIPRGIMLSFLRSVLRRSPVGMSISSIMAAEYEQRYRIRFQAFMNCVEIPDECPINAAGNSSSKLKFIYVGGLHLGRWQSLQDIGKALVVLRAKGWVSELVIHAPTRDIDQHGEALAAINTVRIGGALPQDRVTFAMREADVLVHVESFDPGVRAFTRLSLSTKVPQYMACGKAILAYGPWELASCRYVQDCHCGAVVGEQNSDMLEEALRALILDRERREEFGRRGWAVARENHLGRVVRERFRAVLGDAAASARGVVLSR
jgi:glycosyltransferase involved in cell wall biosynthesis